ncbi:MAG: IS256 family transposase, partial [Planctomycetota bacterium]
NAENGVTWGEVFEDLRRRGLKEVGFVVPNASEGLKDALRRSYPGAEWQRCSVHFMRNVLGRVRAGDAREVRRLLKDVFSAPDRQEAGRRLVKVAEWLRGKGYEKVAEDVEEAGDEVLAFYGLPNTHRRKMRTR